MLSFNYNTLRLGNRLVLVEQIFASVLVSLISDYLLMGYLAKNLEIHCIFPNCNLQIPFGYTKIFLSVWRGKCVMAEMCTTTKDSKFTFYIIWFVLYHSLGLEKLCFL
jgi:hypothetical protein